MTRFSGGFMYRQQSHATLTTTFKQSTSLSSQVFTADITFSGQAVGPADPQRFVFVLFCAKNTANVALNGVTIGGVTATFETLGTTNTPNTNNGMVGIASAYVPAGTTADVKFTWASAFANSAAAGMNINVYTVVGPLALTATDTYDVNTTASPRSKNYSIPAGGVAFSIAATAAVTGAVSGSMTNDVNGTTYVNGVLVFSSSQANPGNVNALTGQTETYTNMGSSGQPGASMARVYGRT